MNVNFIQTFAWLCVSLPLWGQQNLDSAYRTTGSAVVSAFEPQRAVLQISSAVILDGRKEAGYGVVISADGFILTKASEVEAVNKLSVTVDRQNYRDVEIKIVDPVWDVALIKIDAEGLVPVVYAETSDIPHGAWVVANGATSRKRRRAMAGVVSANAREIPATGGAALGVVLKAGAEDLEIEEVNEKSGAHDAGLQPGDILIAINQKPVSKIEDIAEILKECKAGSGVGVTYRRDDEEVTVDVRLSTRGELFSEQMTRNDAMSGDFSKRRSGFPKVMQHDILGSSKVVGGPLLDLDGRCVGMNIARANRAESFAIPVENLREIAERLMRDAP